MIINGNPPQTAVDGLTKRDTAMGENNSQTNCGLEFHEIMRKAVSEASLDRSGLIGNSVEMKNKEVFFNRLEMSQSSRSSSADEETRRKVWAIWMQFMMTGVISDSDLRFLAQHDPGLYRRALEMKQENSECVPDHDETETSQDNATAGSGGEINTGGEGTTGA